MLNTTFTPEIIELEILDIKIGDTIIKRKATLQHLVYDMKSKIVSLTWSITHFAANKDDYGEEISDIIPSTIKTTTADNTTFVNATNGDFINLDTVEPEVEYMGQYDFFARLAQYQPLLINSLIRQYGQQTNWS